MSTLNGEITRIANGADNLRTSINAKLTEQGSNTMPANTKIDGFSPYVDSLEIGGSLDPLYIDGRRFFYRGYRLNQIDNIFPDRIKGFTSMYQCFTSDINNELSFTAHSLDNIDTSHCTTLQGAFQNSNTGSNSIIDMRSWDLSNVTMAHYMFDNDTYNFANVYFPDYSNTTTKPCRIQYMFANRTSPFDTLTSVDLGWIDTSLQNAEYYSNIFYNNTNITRVYYFSLDYSTNDAQIFPSQLTFLSWKPGHAIARDLDNDFTLDLSNCTNLRLSNDFCMNVGEYLGNWSRRIKITQACYDALTTAQKDALTSKSYIIETV